MIVPPLLLSCAALPDKTTPRDSPPGRSTPRRTSMLLFLSTMLQPVRSTDAVVVLPITTTSLPGSSPLGLTRARSIYTVGWVTGVEPPPPESGELPAGIGWAPGER